MCGVSDMALHNDVFKQQIWEFFCDDLESCLTVSKMARVPNSHFKGGLNFTAVLTIFSVIELAAGWWKGKESTHEIIADFIQKYQSKYYKGFENKSFVKKFYGVFRNGLSHQWSPKASGIAMDFYGNWFIDKGGEEGQEEILFLNVPVFYEITKKALRDFEKDLDDNVDMRKLFENRYKVIVDGDYREMRILRDMLEKQNE